MKTRPLSFAGRNNKTRPLRQRVYLRANEADFRQRLAQNHRSLSDLLTDSQTSANIIGSGATHTVFRFSDKCFSGYGLRLLKDMCLKARGLRKLELVSSGHPLASDVQAGVPLLQVREVANTSSLLSSCGTKVAEIVRRLPGIPVCGPRRELVPPPRRDVPLYNHLNIFLTSQGLIQNEAKAMVWRQIRRRPTALWDILRDKQNWNPNLRPDQVNAIDKILERAEQNDSCSLGPDRSKWPEKIIRTMDYLDARARSNSRRFRLFSGLPQAEFNKMLRWMQKLEPDGLELDLDHPANLILLPEAELGVVDTRRRRPGPATLVERFRQLKYFYPLHFIAPVLQAGYEVDKKRLEDKVEAAIR